MVRILHIFGQLNNGGAENMIMNMYRHIDREKFQFDFATHDPECGFFEEEILHLGGRVYRGMPKYRVYNYFAYQEAWKDFFAVHPYEIIHIHTTNSAPAILRAAISQNIPIRICHAHSASEASFIRRMIVKCNQKSIRKNATALYGASDQASLFAFGVKSKVIANGIDAKAFVYDPIRRQQIRKELCISNHTFVLGHVGRFCHAKNHVFLLQLVKKLSDVLPDIKLVLVGDGELFPKIKEQANVLQIMDKIEFLGMRSDISDILQAMDLFVFPSFYEGLPVSVVEAQASGLFCLLSDTITPQVATISELTCFLPIDQMEAWKQKILQINQASLIRENTLPLIMKSGFDISATCDLLVSLYEQALTSKA